MSKKPEKLKYAVIESGGKQYIVAEGEEIEVERLSNKTSKTFTDILLLVDGETVLVGQPYVEGAKVRARVVDHFKGPKVKGFTYKSGTQYRRRYGHRQLLTRIAIEEILV